ncbi:MAG: cytidine deaminase [Peptococcaceae bacterium]|nr:cytidine deaminase [Peptococcaceae bacterium]
MEPAKLIQAALSARDKAYAPYSGFRVGAAVAAGGKIYTGCNIENSSYGLTCCAERVALFKAVSEGERDFSAIAVASDSNDYCSPCGACRQVLAEFGDGMKVYMCSNKGEYQVKTVADLLPARFVLLPG